MDRRATLRAIVLTHLSQGQMVLREKAEGETQEKEAPMVGEK